MSGPWEKYREPSQGPWTRYQSQNQETEPGQGNVAAWRTYLDQQNRIQAPQNTQREDYGQMLDNMAQMRAASGDAPPESISRPEAFARSAGDFFSFGAADELAGAAAGLAARGRNALDDLRGVDGPGRVPEERAGRAREQARALLGVGWEEHPVTSFAGSAAGGIGSGGVVGGALKAAAPRATQAVGLFGRSRPVVAGAAYGAAEGGAYGFGSGEGSATDRLDDAAVGAAYGAAGGAAVPAVFRQGVRQSRNVASAIDEVADLARNRNVAIPQLDELTQARRAAYEAVDNAGARYDRLSVQALTRRVRDRAQQLRLNERLTPKAAAVVDDMQALAEQPSTLSQLDDYRKYVRRNLLQSNDSGERMFGSMITEQIDDFIDTASPIAPGQSAEQASTLIRTARQASRRERAMEALNRAVEEAQSRAARTGTGGNVENTIRQELHKLIKNGARTRSLFDEDQIQLIRQVADGDDIQNLLRAAGGLSPDRGFLPAVAGIGLTAGLGPAGAILPAAGFAARKLGGGRQSAQLDRIRRAVGSTGSGL